MLRVQVPTEQLFFSVNQDHSGQLPFLAYKHTHTHTHTHSHTHTHMHTHIMYGHNTHILLCFEQLRAGVDSRDKHLSILSMVRAIEFGWQGENFHQITCKCTQKQKQSVPLPLSGHAIRHGRNARALSGPMSQCNATSWSQARNSQVD